MTVLKIDRSFVIDLDDGAAGAAMMKGIVELGAGLGIEIICEGVETVEQRRQIFSAGCRIGQGYLWAEPQSAAAISEMLRHGVLGPAPEPGDVPDRAVRRRPGGPGGPAMLPGQRDGVEDRHGS